MTPSKSIDNDGAENLSLPADNPKTEKLPVSMNSKNVPDITNLYQNLTEHFSLTNQAADFVMIVFNFAQFFDDVADGHEVTRKELDLNLYNCFVGLNTNIFFINNRIALVSVMDLIALKWQGSDIAERNNQADERSFMWRAAFYDLLISVISICNGHEFAIGKSVDVMRFYAETMEDYRKEFPKNG